MLRMHLFKRRRQPTTSQTLRRIANEPAESLQEPSEEDLESMTVRQLKNIAISRGIPEPIEGTGADGRVVKQDWINLLRRNPNVDD
jgi:hypothetical protein